MTAAVGGLIGAGAGYLAGNAARPAPVPAQPDRRTVFQTPAHGVPGDTAGTPLPPLAIPAQNPGLPVARGWPAITPGAQIDGPPIDTVFEAKRASPEEMEHRRRIIAGKGLPTGGDTPYVPPKSWNSAEPLPRGPRHGYLDATNSEWTRAKGDRLGTRHWDVRLPSERHLNVGENGLETHGMIRPFRSKGPNR